MGGSTVQQPPTPDPSQTYANVLQSEINLAPQQFAAEAQFDPQYASLYQNVINQSLLGGNGSQGLLATYSQAAPQLGAIQNAANTQQLQGNLGNLQNLGGQAVQAFQNSNPQLAGIQQAMTGMAMGGPPISTYNAPNNPLSYLASWGGQGGGQMQQQGFSGQGGGIQSAGTNGRPATNFQNLGLAMGNIAGSPDMVSNAQGGGPTDAMHGGVMSFGGAPGQFSNPMNVQAQQVGSNWNPSQAMGMATNNGPLSALSNSAQSQLALGGQLPSQTTADISNQVMSAMNTAGRSFDPAAAAQLALSLNSTQQQMLQQRQQAAATAAGLQQQQSGLGLQASGMGLQAGLANQQANLQAGLGNQQAFLGQQGITLQGATSAGQQQLQQNYYNQLAQGQNFGLLQGALGQSNNAIMGTTMPALGMVLNPSGALGAAAGAAGAAAGTPTGSQNFNPFGMGTSLYSNYYDAANSANIANSNSSAGITSGAMGMVGTIGMGAMIAL